MVHENGTWGPSGAAATRPYARRTHSWRGDDATAKMMYGRHRDGYCVTIVSVSEDRLYGNLKNRSGVSDNGWDACLSDVNYDCEHGSANDSHGRVNDHVPNAVMKKGNMHKCQATYMVMVMMAPHGKHTKEVHAKSKGADQQ